MSQLEKGLAVSSGGKESLVVRRSDDNCFLNGEKAIRGVVKED